MVLWPIKQSNAIPPQWCAVCYIICKILNVQNFIDFRVNSAIQLWYQRGTQGQALHLNSHSNHLHLIAGFWSLKAHQIGADQHQGHAEASAVFRLWSSASEGVSGMMGTHPRPDGEVVKFQPVMCWVWWYCAHSILKYRVTEHVWRQKWTSRQLMKVGPPCKAYEMCFERVMASLFLDCNSRAPNFLTWNRLQFAICNA